MNRIATTTIAPAGADMRSRGLRSVVLSDFALVVELLDELVVLDAATVTVVALLGVLLGTMELVVVNVDVVELGIDMI